MHKECLVGVVCRVKRLEREVQFAGHGVVDALAAAGFVSQVVGGPPAAKPGLCIDSSPTSVVIAGSPGWRSASRRRYPTIAGPSDRSQSA